VAGTAPAMMTIRIRIFLRSVVDADAEIGKIKKKTTTN
jgi:hypothetical protein